MFGDRERVMSMQIDYLNREIFRLRKDLSNVELMASKTKSCDCGAEKSVEHMTKELYALYDYLGIEPKVNSGIHFVKKESNK